MQIVRTTIIDMHLRLWYRHIRNTTVSRALRGILISLCKGIHQHKVQVSTQHMSFTPRMSELTIAGRIIAHIQHSLNGMVTYRDTSIIRFPHLVWRILLTHRIVVHVLPFVSLFMPLTSGIVVGSRNYHVVVNIVITRELTQKSL